MHIVGAPSAPTAVETSDKAFLTCASLRAAILWGVVSEEEQAVISCFIHTASSATRSSCSSSTPCSLARESPLSRCGDELETPRPEFPISVAFFESDRLLLVD